MKSILVWRVRLPLMAMGRDQAGHLHGERFAFGRGSRASGQSDCRLESGESCNVWRGPPTGGRVLCAMGYSKAPFRPEYVPRLRFLLPQAASRFAKRGEAVDFDEDTAKKILCENEVVIEVNVNEGDETATAWGCD